MEIEYSGKVKVLPEFGATSDWRHSLDDQINSRMVELASYSSWYPQLLSGGRMKLQLALSLPKKWVAVCSGKKLEETIHDDRVLTRWSSPSDTDILILASPNYRLTSVRDPGASLRYLRNADAGVLHPSGRSPNRLHIALLQRDPWRNQHSWRQHPSCLLAKTERPGESRNCEAWPHRHLRRIDTRGLRTRSEVFAFPRYCPRDRPLLVELRGRPGRLDQ